MWSWRQNDGKSVNWNSCVLSLRVVCCHLLFHILEPVAPVVGATVLDFARPRENSFPPEPQGASEFGHLTGMKRLMVTAFCFWKYQKKKQLFYTAPICFFMFELNQSDNLILLFYYINDIHLDWTTISKWNNRCLVGGLEHLDYVLYMFYNIWDNPSHLRTHVSRWPPTRCSMIPSAHPSHPRRRWVPSLQRARIAVPRRPGDRGANWWTSPWEWRFQWVQQ